MPMSCSGEKVAKEDILTLECDVLVPAAIGGVITEDNANSLQCRYLVEAANGPTTPGGDQILRERGIVVLPDIYTNGGVATPAAHKDHLLLIDTWQSMERPSRCCCSILVQDPCSSRVIGRQA